MGWGEVRYRGCVEGGAHTHTHTLSCVYMYRYMQHATMWGEGEGAQEWLEVDQWQLQPFCMSCV